MSDRLDASKVLHGSDPEVAAFCRALGIEWPGVYRLVLDIKADDIAKVYVEMYGSREALQIITTAPKPPEVVVLAKDPLQESIAELAELEARPGWKKR